MYFAEEGNIVQTLICGFSKELATFWNSHDSRSPKPMRGNDWLRVCL